MKNSIHAESDALQLLPPTSGGQHEDPLLQAIARSPAGLSIGEIEIQENSSRRTLQRRLSLLVEEGVLQTSGRGRATRYVLGSASTQGYEHTLVAEYQPDVDTYLPAPVRQGFRALNRKLRSRHTAALQANPGAALAALLWPHWSRELIWNSSRLSGGRYEYSEAVEFLETGLPLPGRAASDAQNLLNHLEAIRYAAAPDAAIDELTLRNLHAMLTDNLLAHPMDGGTLRQHPYAGPPQHPALVLRLLVERTNGIEDPFEQSFFLFLHLSCLQLFAHGNARLARIAANLPLLRADLCPITFSEVPLALYHHAAHENSAGPRMHLLRELYLRAYETSCSRCAALPPPGSMNPLRLRYRKELSTMVRETVQSRMNRQAAQQHLRATMPDTAEHPPAALRDLAIQELDALHAGNIYRHGLSLEEFQQWKTNWMDD